MTVPDGVPPGEVERELNRVADRLAVVAPRLARREDEAARAVMGRVREALQALADLAADAEGREHRPVPVLAPHAVTDQVLVLGHDVLRAGAEPGGPAALAGALDVLVRLRRTL